MGKFIKGVTQESEIIEGNQWMSAKMDDRNDLLMIILAHETGRNQIYLKL